MIDVSKINEEAFGRFKVDSPAWNGLLDKLDPKRYPNIYDVLGLNAMGFSGPEIEVRTGVSLSAISKRIKKAREAWSLDNKVQAAITARKAGIFSEAIKDRESGGPYAFTRQAMSEVVFMPVETVTPKADLGPETQEVLDAFLNGGENNVWLAAMLGKGQRVVAERMTEMHTAFGTGDRARLSFVASFAELGLVVDTTAWLGAIGCNSTKSGQAA